MRRGKENKTLFVSFSGMDGAGKSTQIAALRARLEEMGLRVRTIAFWNEIAVLTGVREGAGHAIFGGDKGVGSPAAPINRRDKNVRSWPMSCVRLCIYFLDAISVQRVVARAMRSYMADILIFDRYIYDELANLSLRNPMMRAYAWIILRFVPRPRIRYLLDADPVQARTRKPEYPLEFLYENRQVYLDLSSFAEMTVVAPMPMEETKRAIWEHALKGLSFGAGESENGAHGTREDNGCTNSTKLDGPFGRPAAS